jgi:hypothetical protein
MNHDLKLQAWECDEYVIVLDGKTVGQTVHERDGNLILRWLSTALNELGNLYAHPPPPAQPVPSSIYHTAVIPNNPLDDHDHCKKRMLTTKELSDAGVTRVVMPKAQVQQHKEDK